MHVELTSKGEIRPITAAGAEVKGAFKLIFYAKQAERRQDENQHDNEKNERHQALPQRPKVERQVEKLRAVNRS
jgi:hypothetical protein